MPPLKRKTINNKSTRQTSFNYGNKQKKSSNKDYDVEKIISCRLIPKKDKLKEEGPNYSGVQFLVKWKNYDASENSWEPFEFLRLNTEFIKFINEKFRQYEADIFVTIANIKEKLKFKRRKTLQEDLKVVIMMNVYPFDPLEYKVKQVVYHLLSGDRPKWFKPHLEDLVFRNHFFKLDEVQRIKHDKMAKEMTELEGIKITIENDIDFECPPEFEYITKNVYSEELLLANDTLNQSSNNLEVSKRLQGCKCGKFCSKDTECCPKMLDIPFAYKESRNSRLVRLLRQEPLIECNDNCNCDQNCLNRVTQQKRTLSLCLFKTESRGWAVKTMTQIKKGEFILEYTGEMIGNAEAGKREQFEYLFDLNMDRLSHGYYTIDAFSSGNLARFVNHSCEPNCSMWIVSDITKNPKNQKLCIFALRNLEKDEEITIDYSPLESVPTTDRMNGSRSFYVECNCGSNACRAKRTRR